MAETSTIEWTDATWNPITGCSVVSPGCTNCYAMKLAGTRMKHHPSRAGLTEPSKAGPVWNGQVRLNEGWLDQPRRWKRPRRIFVCAHGDLFHENVPAEWIARVFNIMSGAPHHVFQLLTKRADRMRAFLAGCADGDKLGWITHDGTAPAKSYGGTGIIVGTTRRWPLPNVWLGVSAEDQQRYDERREHLEATPAALRFISAEPLLGQINLKLTDECYCDFESRELLGSADRRHAPPCAMAEQIDWIIAVGESGPGARPMHPDWARSLRDQCAAAGVPFFFKQWGAWSPEWAAAEAVNVDPSSGVIDRPQERGIVTFVQNDDTMFRVGKKAAGASLDGREHREFPSDITER